MHIVFAILEVLQYDFPGVYSMIARPEFYAYIQYPGYRWQVVKSLFNLNPNVLTESVLLRAFT